MQHNGLQHRLGIGEECRNQSHLRKRRRQTSPAVASRRGPKIPQKRIWNRDSTVPDSFLELLPNGQEKAHSCNRPPVCPGETRQRAASVPAIPNRSVIMNRTRQRRRGATPGLRTRAGSQALRRERMRLPFAAGWRRVDGWHSPAGFQNFPVLLGIGGHVYNKVLLSGLQTVLAWPNFCLENTEYPGERFPSGLAARKHQ